MGIKKLTVLNKAATVLKGLRIVLSSSEDQLWLVLNCAVEELAVVMVTLWCDSRVQTHESHMNPELCSESLTLSVFVKLFWFAVVWSISSTTLTRTDASAGLILTVGNGRWNNKQKWHFEQPTFPWHEIFIIVFSTQRIFYVLYFDLSIYI